MPQAKAPFAIVRVYEDRGHSPNEYKILADRLWPRGIRKDTIEMDEWPKILAPSSDLRKWYSHDISKYNEFAQLYRKELELPVVKEKIMELIEISKTKRIILLTATKDVAHSAANVLMDYLCELLNLQ